MTSTTPPELDVLDSGMPEFETPPPDPLRLLREWYAQADADGVDDPGALALATVDGHGVPSSRVVKILELSPGGMVFTSHAVSRKGRDIAETGRGSGVHYWRELGRQIVVAGRIAPMGATVSARFWGDRALATNAMSVATVQSAPLTDQHDLLDRARGLAAPGHALARPETWVAYELVPSSIEFWHVGVERLHRRLRYDAGPGGWTATLLQP